MPKESCKTCNRITKLVSIIEIIKKVVINKLTLHSDLLLMIERYFNLFQCFDLHHVLGSDSFGEDFVDPVWLSLKIVGFA